MNKTKMSRLKKKKKRKKLLFVSQTNYFLKYIFIYWIQRFVVFSWTVKQKCYFIFNYEARMLFSLCTVNCWQIRSLYCKTASLVMHRKLFHQIGINPSTKAEDAWPKIYFEQYAVTLLGPFNKILLHTVYKMWRQTEQLLCDRNSII